MATFTTAYVIVWLAVALYVVRLAHGQRQLLGKIERLHSRLEEADEKDIRSSKAA